MEFFFVEQKTSYDMRIVDWSSDVCSSDLDEAELVLALAGARLRTPAAGGSPEPGNGVAFHIFAIAGKDVIMIAALARPVQPRLVDAALDDRYLALLVRSEEHTSELQSLMRISYAVFCLNKKKTNVHRNICTPIKHD